MKKGVNQQGKSTISRRDFIKGAAAGAIGVATMGLLGACSDEGGATTSAAASTSGVTESTTVPNSSQPTTVAAETETSSASVEEMPVVSSSDLEWLGEEPVISDAEISETLETEVLVVGAGTAGLFAACSSAENNASTLVIEKFAGGGGVRDDLGAIGSRYQIEEGMNIDKQEIIREMQHYASNRCNQKLYKLWADESAEAIDWYGDLLSERDVVLWNEAGWGNEGDNYKHFPTGHSPDWPVDADGNKPLNGGLVLTEYAESIGVEFQYETTMVKLIKDGDRVAGVIAENADGDYIQINASKGVIVCTGGYARNHEMLEALQPETFKLISFDSSIPGTSGDGIKACIWAGAKFDDIHTSMLFDRGAIMPDQTSGFDADGAMFWMGSQPFLKVNLNGERFSNESGPYDFILHAAAEQPGSCYCTIWDSSFEEDIYSFGTVGCSRMFEFENGAPPNIPLKVVMGMNEGMIESGHIQVADSFEELAEKLNIPADTFVETVNHYNELCANGEDTDFGKELHRLKSVDEPPYYGVRTSARLLCTLDGIQIDTNMNALDESGNVIPGLYVCGNDSGGYYAYTYPNLSTGNAAGRSVTFARRAGRIAAGN